MTTVFDRPVPALPAWEVHRGRVRGCWALGLIAPTTTSREFGILPATTVGLAAAAQQLGLPPLTPDALREPPKTGLIIVVSSRDVHVEHEGLRVFTLTADRAYIEHALDRGDGALLLILGPRLEADRSFAAMVRHAAAARSHFAGLVEILDLRSRDSAPAPCTFFRSGRMGTETSGLIPSNVGNPMAVILDLNIVIALRKAIEGASETAFDAVRDLAVSLRGLDIIPGFALAESSTAMQSDPADVHRKLTAALDAWWEAPVADLSHGSLRRRYEANLQDPLRASSAPDARSVVLTNLNYAMLLDLARIWSDHAVGNYNPTSRVEAYGKHIARFSVDGLGVSAYCLGVARVLLFGRDVDRGQMEKLLRLKTHQTMDRRFAVLRAAAWDLFYPLAADLAASGQLDDTPGKACYLVTGDRPLARLVSQSSLSGVLATGESQMGILHLRDNFDSRLMRGHLDRIKQLEYELFESATLRGVVGAVPNFMRIEKMITNLEYELAEALGSG